MTSSFPAAPGQHGVVHEQRHRHRADAAWYRRDRAGDTRRALCLDVAHELRLAVASRHTMNADVHDDDAGTQPIALHEARAAGGGDQDLGGADKRRYVAALRV